MIKFKAIKMKDYWILILSKYGLKLKCCTNIAHMCRIDNMEFCKLIERYGGSIQSWDYVDKALCTFINKEDCEAAIEAIYSILVMNKLV